jgi:ATP-binding cassette subfamily F protein uup
VILVDAQGIAASRPGKPLFDQLSVTVSSGDRLGVLGVNGCGKSTLLRMLAGTTEPEAGRVLRGRDLVVSVLDQQGALPEGTALAAVEEVAGDASWEAAAVLDRLGLGGHLDAQVSELSGGQAKRVALARALVTPSDLLVLDEPTNHLDVDAIAWLEQRLGGFKGGLVLVTHDRHLLARLTNRVLEIDGGRAHLHDGGYDAYLLARSARIERELAEENTRQNLARRELEWLRRGAPARTAKSKAHIRRALEVQEAPTVGAAAASGRDASADLVRVDAVGGSSRPSGARGWGVNRHVDTPRLGDKVIELHGVDAGWPGGRMVLSGVDLALGSRERLGVVGPNGAGKTTLLEVLAGRIEPLAGRREVGSTVRLGYFGQRGPEIDLSLRVREVVAGPHRTPDWRDAALLERFWFGADAQWAPVELLSGGERRRLQLLVVLAAHPNVLLLDEPTNDLDLDTLRLVEDFCEDWPGALVVVSHDRAFLDRTVDDVVVVDGSGGVGRHPGGYAAWDAARRESTGGRGGTLRGSSPSTDRPGAPARREAGRSQRSVSTIRHELRAADRQVSELTNRREDLVTRLSSSTDHQTLAALGVELGDVDAALATAEERWLALAAEAEERGLLTQ